ncbi:MAG TPA: hypothetical protein VI217_00825 [Mycobacterium sp.]
MTWAIATPVPHTSIRRWLIELTHLVTHVVRRPPRRKPPPSIAHREAFIEDAAMAREMFRL